MRQIKDKILNSPLDTLKKYIPQSNGATVRSRNPITEPQPCILAERVSRLLFSPTEKIPERIQAPTA